MKRRKRRRIIIIRRRTTTTTTTTRRGWWYYTHQELPGACAPSPTTHRQRTSGLGTWQRTAAARWAQEQADGGCGWGNVCSLSMRRSRHFRFRLCRLLHLCRVRFRFRWKRWFRLVEHLEQREREIEKDREREWECLLSSLWSSKKTTSRYHTEEPLINARVGVGMKCLRVTFYWRHFNRKENLETKLWPKNLKVLKIYLRIRWYFSCRIISVDVNHFIHNIRVPFVLRRPLFLIFLDIV